MKTIAMIGAVAIASQAADAAVIHEAGGLNDQAQDVTIGLSSADFTTAEAVYTVTNQTVDSETFDYTVTVSPVTNTTDIGTGNGGLVDASSGVSFFQHDDVISITVAVTNNTNVVFDGFVNFGLNFNGTGDGFNIEGVDYVRGTATNGDSDPRHGIAIAGGIIAQDSVEIRFIAAGGAGNDANVLRGFAYQFSAVPEPGCAALLLAGCGLFAARRRR